MSDTNERSVASAGSVAAWAVMDGTKTLVGYHSCSRDKAEAWAREYGFPEVVPLYRHTSPDYELRLEVISLRARNKDLQLANDKLLKRLAEGISPEANEANAKRRQKVWECEGSANWGLGVARDIGVLYDKIELLRSRIAELEKQP